MKENKLPEPINTLHKEAIYNKQKYYIDPATGKKVLTSYYLKNRGFVVQDVVIALGTRRIEGEKKK